MIGKVCLRGRRRHGMFWESLRGRLILGRDLELTGIY
jgi:hypothetical protein